MTSIPREIELLFNNIELEVARFLVHIYVLQGRRRGITVEECIFYELVSVESRYTDKEYKERLRHRYFKISCELPKILIYMENCKYISVLSKKAKRIEELSITIEDKGKRFVIDLESDYFEILKESIKMMQEEKKYSKSEYKNILGVLNERD